jgi:hypothetical protein
MNIRADKKYYRIRSVIGDDFPENGCAAIESSTFTVGNFCIGRTFISIA